MGHPVTIRTQPLALVGVGKGSPDHVPDVSRSVTTLRYAVTIARAVRHVVVGLEEPNLLDRRAGGEVDLGVGVLAICGFCHT